MKFKGTILFVLFSLVLFSSCTHNVYDYATIETKVIATEMDGVYVLRVQGKGTTYRNALIQAEKQAVHDVIFKNLHKTYGDHSMLYSILQDPTIEDQNERFFSAFFSNDGEYRTFLVSTDKERQTGINKTLNSCVINVAVNRNALKRMLEENGILKY